jgi:hypothetical protein
MTMRTDAAAMRARVGRRSEVIMEQAVAAVEAIQQRTGEKRQRPAGERRRPDVTRRPGERRRPEGRWRPGRRMWIGGK